MSDRVLPDGWTEGLSKSRGIAYYINNYTNESQWEFPNAPAQPPSEKVRVRHLLVKHDKSRRPSSWREEVITRTESEAQSILQSYRDEIMNSENPGKKFEEMAQKYSDCNSARHGGIINFF
jgi:NIMA-interacting peptidyl-prolyl cis-trans isomerase 1